jgi:hypothetical protein
MRSKSVFVLLFLFTATVQAAGFLDFKDGVPYKWSTSAPIPYKIDQGGLGGIGNAAATTLADDSFDIWRDVAISNIDFANDGQISEDVAGPVFTGDESASEFLTKCNTEGNYLDHVFMDVDGAPRNVGSETEILFDSDGSIIDCLLGQGASDAVLGFASAGAFNENTMTITAGIAIINGKDADAIQVQATMTHEFGHMLNLQHSQLNFGEAFDSNDLNDNVVPTMFPFLLGDASEGFSLTPDDEFSIAYLYPDSTGLASKGSISGHVVRRTGEGVRGVNVICRNVVDPKTDAVSWSSDQVIQDEGEYICGNLTHGEDYTVEIEPIFLAINFYTPDPPFIASEKYNGSSESFDPEVDDIGRSTNVAVSAGEDASDIDIILNENGRLISGQSMNGASSSFFPELEYFITVPAGAKSVRFQLDGFEEDVDIDIMGRCDVLGRDCDPDTEVCNNEFSLPVDSTAYPLVSQTGLSQADFVGDSTTGNETVTLDSGSTPAIQGCTYHLLVVNYTVVTNPDKTTDFTITATIDGQSPTVELMNLQSDNGNGGSGELLMLSQRVKAQDDTYRLKDITYIDGGTGDLSEISEARLYLDSDGDGAWDPESDELLTTTTEINADKRKIAFSGMDQFFDAGTKSTLFVTYTFNSNASVNLWFLLAVSGMAFGFVRRRDTLKVALVCVVFMGLGSCSGSKPPYEPKLTSDQHVTIIGQTYGDQINIKVSTNDSIHDYFSN